MGWFKYFFLSAFHFRGRRQDVKLVIACNLVSIVQARPQPIRCISSEAELWFQRGGRRLLISGGASCDGHSLWLLARHKPAHCYGLCTSWPCFLQLLATGILILWMLSEMKDPAQNARTWPGLDLLSRPLDRLFMAWCSWHYYQE